MRARTGAWALDVSTASSCRTGRGLASFPASLKLIPGLSKPAGARVVVQGKAREVRGFPFFPCTGAVLPSAHPLAVSLSAVSRRASR